MKSLIVLCILIALLNTANAGEFYKCVDQNGNTVLTTNPQEGMKCKGIEGIGSEEPTDGEPQSCEIVNYSQYEVASGISSTPGWVTSSGFIVGGNTVTHHDTCVELTIKNNDSVARTITDSGIIAVTKKGKTINSEGFMVRIRPKGMYKGKACFGRGISAIVKLTCNFSK